VGVSEVFFVDFGKWFFVFFFFFDVNLD